MECSCTVPQDEGDYVQLIHTAPRIASIPHKCNECHSTIQPTQWFEREVYEFQGVLKIHKTCEHCWSLRQVFFSDGWCYGVLWDQMQEFIDECQGDISVECIRMLTPVARGKVLDMVEEVWEELNDNEA